MPRLLEGEIKKNTAIIVLVAYSTLLAGLVLMAYKYFYLPVEGIYFTDYLLKKSMREVNKQESPEGHVNIGWSYFLKYTETKEKRYLDMAEKEYQTALQMDSTQLAAKYNLGLLTVERGKSEEAIRIFQDIVTTYPRHNLAHYNLGQLYLKKGQLDQAIKSLKRTLEISPGSANVLVDLGLAYEKKKDKQKALEAFTYALAYDPQNKEAKAGLQRLK